MVQTSREGGLCYQTGEAGSGKSTNLNLFRRACKKHGRSLVVTAPTGLAAMNVQGSTIDRLFGWRPGITGAKQLHSDTKERVLRSGMIVIDEVSMFRADKFDRMDRDLRNTMKNEEPFGGIGIFCIGDHFQLEPVLPSSGPERDYFDRQGYRSPFFFDSHVWQRCKVQINRLTKVYRQQGDTSFIDALNAIRVNDSSALAFINERAHAMPSSGAIKLCFHNKVADSINTDALAMLSTQPVELIGKTTGDLKDTELPSPKNLYLKIGCRVMATANGRHSEEFDEPFINGDMGTVTGFTGASPVVVFDRGFTFTMEPYVWGCAEVIMGEDGNLFAPDAGTTKEPTFTQYPLKLAYGISVHKSQGMTLSKVHLQIDDFAFAGGQAYVALSRCSDFNTMSLSRRLTKRDLLVHPRIVEWHQENISSMIAA